MSTADAEIQCSEFERIFSLMPDVPAIYAEWESLVTQHAVMGKKAHDARIVAAMKVHNISHLLKFNGDDFKTLSRNHHRHGTGRPGATLTVSLIVNRSS